jgi:hypothetical protein
LGKVITNGLRYLKRVQDSEGCFGDRSSARYVYGHAIAALAMVEAYGMTGAAIHKGPAQKALDFIALSRTPGGGWRYGIQAGDADTSVTGWMMMALKSAELINASDVKRGKPPSLALDSEAFRGVRTWIEKMTDPDVGRVGYLTRGSDPARPPELLDRFPAKRSESTTAIGVLARVFVGEDPRTNVPIQRGAALLAACLPEWNPASGSIDMYYWYYGTLAAFQVGGKTWRAWDSSLPAAIVATQRKGTDFCGVSGSWDPIDPWGDEGGRVYATALMAMCLEVYYRYERVFGTASDR